MAQEPDPYAMHQNVLDSVPRQFGGSGFDPAASYLKSDAPTFDRVVMPKSGDSEYEDPDDGSISKTLYNGTILMLWAAAKATVVGAFKTIRWLIRTMS